MLTSHSRIKKMFFHIRRLRSVSRLGTVARYLIVVAFLALTLYPAIFTPLVADDLAIAMDSSQTLNQKWFWQFIKGVESFGGAGHFNVLAQIYSFTYSKVWAESSVAFGLDLLWGFWIQKVFWYAIVVISMSWLLWRIDGSKRFLTIFTIISISFGSIIQIHTPWSNDPVTNFIIGFSCVPFAMFAIYRTAIAFEKNDIRSDLIAAFAVITSVFVYELNAAVIAATVVMAFWKFVYLPLRRSGIEKVTFDFLGASRSVFWTFLLPLIVFVMIRTMTIKADYSGTMVNPEANKLMETFAIGFLSSLPVAGWQVSIATVGSPFVNQQANAASLFALTLLIAIVLLNLSHLRFESKERQSQVSPNLSSAIVGIVVYGIASIGIQASTLKVQAEVAQIGSVYTFYAPALCALVVFLAFVALRSSKFLLALIMCISAILPTQINLNWVLSDLLDSQLVVTSRLTYLATNPGSDKTQCEALELWLQIPWPEYYKEVIVFGLNGYSQEISQKNFCSYKGSGE